MFSHLLLLLPLALAQNSFDFASQPASSSSSGSSAFGDFPPSPPPPSPFGRRVGESGGGGSPSFCHNRWGGRGGRMAWAREATTEERNAMREVFFNRQLNFAQKQAMVDHIVAKESPQVQAAYAKSKQEMATRKAQMMQTHDALAAKLSPQARQAESSLSQFFMNQNLTWRERRQQLRQIMDSLPEDIRKELTAMREEMHKDSPWGGRWRNGGGGGGGWRGRRLFN